MSVIRYFFVFLCFITLSANLRAQETPTTLKAFKFYSLDGKAFTNANLKAGMATIFFYFSPDCDHCNQQAAWIQAGLAQFKNVQFVWITDSDDQKQITDFKTKYFSKATMPVHFVQDKDYKIDNYFGYSQVPSIYIYGTKNQLTKALKKETPVAELIPHIK